MHAIKTIEVAPNVPALAYGHVVEVDELTVRIGGRVWPAKRAKSCLVAPDRGDRVLCSLDGLTAYVLAVLDGDRDAHVVVEGKLELRAAELEMRARSAVAALDELRLLSRSIEASVADRAALFAERVEARASRFLQRAKRAFRIIEETEQVRAGHYDVRAEGLASMRGENTIVTARVLAKLDGEQVKIG